MEAEFQAIEDLSRKLNQGEIHISAFGRVSVGKSSVLNALLGEALFSTSPLHGETRHAQSAQWHSETLNGVMLIDTPGIDELDGQDRERLAKEVAKRSDLILFICEGDLSRTEIQALELLAGKQRPVIIVLNKTDRYTSKDIPILLQPLEEKTAHLKTVRGVFGVSADPRPITVVRKTADGEELESRRTPPVDISALKSRLWEILDQEGKTLAALNAALFATELDEKVGRRIVQVRRELAERVTRSYSVAKGLTVAVNPIPVADLLAAAGADVAMVIHLGKIYGFQLSKKEAGGLLLTIAGQLAALMGAYWGVNLVSSALKGLSAGFSTVITAGAQGALAYYATYLVGRSAEAYFLAGRSWGPDGPKTIIRGIVDSLPRDSILVEAKEDILKRLQYAD